MAPDRPVSTEHADERFDQLHELVRAAALKADAASKKVDQLSMQLDAIAANVSKLASARLLQQAFTSIVLAGGLTVLIKVLGG